MRKIDDNINKGHGCKFAGDCKSFNHGGLTMNIGLRINHAAGQFMRAGLPGGSTEKHLTGVSAAGKKAAEKASQTPGPSLRMRMAERNAAQSTLPQGKREIVFDSASGTSYDAQRVSRSLASAQKKMKKLQYNFKLISSQIMRAKTSSSAAKAVSSAKRMVAQLRRKRKSGEYDDEELEAAIMHAQAMERVAKKHVKNLQQEERVERGMKAAADPLPEEEREAAEDTFVEDVSESGDDFSEDPSELMSEAMAQIQEELADDIEVISQELSEEMAQLMQEYEDMMSETMEELGGDLLESLSVADTDMEPEDLKALKQKHRAKELQEIAKADAKYLKAIFQKYAADHQQAASGVNRIMGASGGVSGVGGMNSVGGMAPQTAAVSASPSAPSAASAAGGSVDVSV